MTWRNRGDPGSDPQTEVAAKICNDKPSTPFRDGGRPQTHSADAALSSHVIPAMGLDLERFMTSQDAFLICRASLPSPRRGPGLQCCYEEDVYIKDIECIYQVLNLSFICPVFCFLDLDLFWIDRDVVLEALSN